MADGQHSTARLPLKWSRESPPISRDQSFNKRKLAFLAQWVVRPGGKGKGQEKSLPQRPREQGSLEKDDEKKGGKKKPGMTHLPWQIILNLHTGVAVHKALVCP